MTRHIVTDQEREAYIRALLRERDGYVALGDVSHVEAVNRELARLGVEARVPAARAARRTV